MKKSITTFFFVAIATFTFAQRTFSQGPNYKMEIDSLTTKIKNHPDSSALYFDRSKKIFEFNSQYPKQTTVTFKLKDAYSDIDKAISMDSSNASYYVRRAEFKEYENNLDGALADFTKAIQFSPNDGILYKKRGAVYVNKQDYDNACLDYKKGHALKEPTCKNFIGIYCK